MTVTTRPKLHIGAGRYAPPGWINCDLYPSPGIDVAFDVQKDWPFPDNYAGELYTSHMLEHLDDPLAFFREAWRVLAPNASLLIRCPYGGHRSAWWDLTHRRPWYVENFACLQPGYGEAVSNPQHDAWRWPYGIGTIDVRVSGRFAPWLRRRWQRRLLLPHLDLFPEFGEELWAHLWVLKTPDAITEYRRTHEAFTVPCRYVMYGHQLRGRPMPSDGTPVELVPIADLNAMTRFRS